MRVADTKRLALLTSAILLSGPSLSPALAQTVGAEAKDDIVVTALRRDGTLQDVPAAVTAFTSEAIENAGIDKPSDFISLTSNVNLVETQNAGNAFIIIRGITQARNSEPRSRSLLTGCSRSTRRCSIRNCSTLTRSKS